MRWLLWLAALLVACGGGRADRTTELADEMPDGLDGELAIQLVETLVKAKAYQNAMPMLQRSLRKTPKDPRLHYLMGVVLRDRGVYLEARKSFARALELSPKLPPALSDMGVLLDLQGDHAGALDFHRRAVKLAPESARYHNNLGFNRYLAQDLAGAVAAYKTGLRADPTAHRLYLNLGFALGAQGKDAEALRMFEQAVPGPAARTNLALARELRGDTTAARRMYLEVLNEMPGQSQAALNLEALEAGARAPTKETP